MASLLRRMELGGTRGILAPHGYVTANVTGGDSTAQVFSGAHEQTLLLPRVLDTGLLDTGTSDALP